MRLCFFGDSFVNGTGDPECLGWAGRICADARRNGSDLTYYNLGVRRDTTRDIAERWRHEALIRLPSDIDGRLIFSFGVNDCLLDAEQQRVRPDIALETAREILAQASEWRPTLFIGPPPIADNEANERIATLSFAFLALCAEQRVPFFDAFTPLSTSRVWMREVADGDGAHPGAAGYALFADLLGAWRPWREWIPTGTSSESSTTRLRQKAQHE
jgi:lysophospholipase L1-like esterase